MSQRLLSVCLLLVTTCLFPAELTADEVFLEDGEKEPSVSVLCHGRLRHGVVAVGGETTGTTITFNRVTWELQLPDEASREFAKRNHQEPAVVTGTLRKVVGTEKLVRWIVHVKKLTESDSRDLLEEGAKVTIRGTLRAALSQTGDIPELSVRADDQIWRLDFTANRETQTAAESFIGQSVLLTGSVLPLPEETERGTTRPPTPATHSVRVKTIEASANAAADSRFFK
jgi:hypothetical protein